MINRSSFLRYTAIAALAAGGALASAAHAADLHPAGPFIFQGHIEVDISEVGPPITNFACKIEGQGRILDNNGGVAIIESVQALNHAANNTSTLCATVNMYDLPWIMTVSGSSATISGVKFDSPAVDGDGCEGNISGTWQEDTTFAPPNFLAPSFSRMVVDGPVAMTTGDTCYIQKMVIKMTRRVGPVLVP